jgi:hypothetical protein
MEPSGAQTKWQQRLTDDFVIYHAEAEQVYARELATALQLNIESLSRELNLPLRERVIVYFVSSQKDFDRLTGNAIPHWGEGIADPVRNLIVLKSPSMTDNHARFQKLIRHELVHILIGQAVSRPQELPKWFNEGMALIYSGDAEFAYGQTLSRAMLTDELIPLNEIEYVLKFQQAKARLAYEQSYAFTYFLIEKYGEYRLLDLLSLLQKDISFDQAFISVYAVHPFDLELQWFEYLHDKYRWRFLQDFDTFLWIMIPVLFIIAFVAIKLRNRKTVRRWESEDLFHET